MSRVFTILGAAMFALWLALSLTLRSDHTPSIVDEWWFILLAVIPMAMILWGVRNDR